MTEAELIEASTQYMSLSFEMMTIYLTVTSGFLIVSYFAGKTLSRSQLTVVTCLFAVASSLSTYLMVGNGLRSLYYIEELRKVSPDTVLYGTPLLAWGMGAVFLMGILASLKFVWDIRRN